MGVTKILNFGSLNIDHVYAVEHLARPGETVSSSGYRVFMGGKGGNQSIAIARAGVQVFHAGRIGPEGVWLSETLKRAGVDVRFLLKDSEPGGHAIIQVDRSGENSIVIHGGANRGIGRNDISRVFSYFGKGDWLLLQNEISATAEIIRAGRRRGMSVVFNPAPMDDRVARYPLSEVDTFVLNEVEAARLSGCTDPEKMAAAMARKFPCAKIVLTLGSAGVLYRHDGAVLRVPGFRVKAVDTTAAGDTFAGYYVAGMAKGGDVAQVLAEASAAAALCVTRRGASDSIPRRREVLSFMRSRRTKRRAGANACTHR